MEWLKARLRELGKRPIDLARHLEIPSPRVYELLAGKRRLQTREIGPTAKFLEWPEATLLARVNGAPVPKTPLRAHPPPGLPVFDGNARTPLELWPSTEAGEDGGMVISRSPIDFIPRPGFLPHRGAFAVYLRGNGMSPAYEHGDQLFVDSNKPVREGADSLFVRELDDGTLMALPRRLIHASAGKWQVRQFNPDRESTLARRDWAKAWPIVGKMNRP